MSNIKSIATTIAARQGILCVRVEDLQTREDCAAGEADERQRKAMRALCQLSEVYGHKEHVRAVIGEPTGGNGSRTIVCFTNDSGCVAVVVMFPTGATVAKSLNRMIRRVLSASDKGKLPRAA